MLYRVLLDGEDILDFSDPELVLLSPQVNMELDTTGSFEFTVPPNHKFYNYFDMSNIMSMTIEVYEGDIQHFFGRPIELHLDFYQNKKIYCEGAMGYFNDSVQREKEYDEGTYLSEFFMDVIQRHNEMVEESRQFQIERMTVPDHQIYRKIDFEQTADVLKSKLLDAEEGHFFLERRNGVNYISFLRDDVMPYECNQTVEFAKNLLNFTYSFDGKDFATCVLPLGATISESDGGTGEPLTIASVNGGSDVLVGNSAANYGRIIKAENYSDIRTPEELLAEGRKYLTKLQYNATIIECSAVDLHGTDHTKTPFRLGQMVHCVSDPHGIDLDLPLSKISLYLDSAAKQITLGRIPKKTLSRFYKDEVSTAGRSSGGGGIGGGTSEGVDPGWYIVYPEDPGGTPTMNKSPVRMKITHMPFITEYDDGETINFAGIECTLLSTYSTAAEEEIFTDERYPLGIIPFDELIFSPTVMPSNPKISTAQFVVKWKNPYKKNSTFACSFVLINKTSAAAEQAAIAQHGSAYPAYIDIANRDSQQYQSYVQAAHKDGEYLKIPSGWVVKAYYPDGSPYDMNGYSDGRIPHTELILSPKVINISEEDLDQQYGPSGIPTSSSGKMTRTDGSYHTLSASSGVRITYFPPNGGSWSFIAASKSPGGTVTRYVGGEIEQTYSVNSTYTKNGKTVYYMTASASLTTPDVASVTPGPVSYVGDNKDLAFEMVYGKQADDVLIPVTISWKAPDGNVLTTSFAVNAKSDITHQSGSF